MEENQQNIPAVPQGSNPLPVESVQPVAKPTKKYGIVAVVVIVVLVVAGWFAYSAYASPSRVWQKFVTKPMAPTTVKEDFSMSYQDNGHMASSTGSFDIMSGFLNKAKFSMQGNVYVGSLNTKSPDMTMDLSYSVGNGDTSFSSAAHMIMKDQVVYMNLGDNPVITGILGMISPDSKIEWIKIDPKAMQEAVNSSSTPTVNFDYAQQVKDYQAILAKHISKVVVIDKFLGKETLHGVQTMHYANKLDKNELKLLAQDIVSYVLNIYVTQGLVKQPDVAHDQQTANAVLSSLISRLEVSKLETWVGSQDFQLHKLSYVSNAPSIASLVSQASAMSENQDSMNNPEQAIVELMNKVSFDAQLTSTQELYDYGIVVDVKAPANSFDMAAKLKQMEQQKNDFTTQPEPIESMPQ